MDYAQEEAVAAAGMPQLDFSVWPNQIFWLLIALGAIYFILTRIALPRISGVLSERNGTIANDIAQAEELKLKAKAAEEAYTKALADARTESGRIAEAARAEIQKELDAAIAHADAEIAARTAESEARIADIRAGAAESVREVAHETARAIVTALGGRAGDEALVQAVDQRVKG
ncbi:ATP F0F1 synthase subunit B' [Haematobacter missouriensis]|nr:F0F1 ATP synthase subunit B' [Haematobacter missouriensis]KFI34151.1 ATP F0F1 synthase subunit B' [Haematobacter missouriensis]